MKHRLFLLSLATLLLSSGACKRQPVQPRPPGMVDGDGKLIENAPAKAPPAEPPPAPEAPTVYDFERPRAADPGALRAKLPPTGLAPGSALGVPASADSGAPERDLNAELSAALSPVSSCVDVVQAAAQADGRLTISVTAHVQGSGRVSRATVTAPGQPASALACVEKQVLALSLRGPIPNAPTQVTGSTQLQIRKAGGSNAQTPAAAANPIRPQPTSPDIAKPDPGETAGPP